MQSSSSSSSIGSDVSSSNSSVQRFRLLREQEEEEEEEEGNVRYCNRVHVSPPAKKRFKLTGEHSEFKLRQLKYSDKIQTNDEVHQSIEVCPVMKALVDTEVFQRLRNILQLGASQYVYDCANGNRFQHSLGVAFLAEKMAASIKAEQPALQTTEKDVLCVKLAGLLHDIGHGPYSHLYEEFRIKHLPKFLEENPDLKKEYDDCRELCVPPDWSHEQSSLIMVDAALRELGLQIDKNNLDKPLKQIGCGVDANSIRVFKPSGIKDCILTSRDFIFIKECIYGKPLEENHGQFLGRQQRYQEWLYDIVNNRHNGLDVDKIDYFARDHGRTLGSSGIDTKMIEDARVASGRCSRPGKCPVCLDHEPGMHYMICYPKKRVEATMEFFKKRLKYHSIVYQHKKTNAVTHMLVDILSLADPFFRLHSYNGERYPISRAASRSDFLQRLDDNVITLIEHSADERLREAQKLCRRLRRHDMYKCAVDKPLNIDDQSSEICTDTDSSCDEFIWSLDEHEIQSGMLHEMNFWNEGTDSKTNQVGAKDFIVDKYCMHHGAKNYNPLVCMRFFDEMNERLFGPIEDLPVAEQIKISDYNSIVPRTLQKVGIRIYCRDSSKRDIICQLFHQWYERMRRGEVGEREITPSQFEVYQQNKNEEEMDVQEDSQYSGAVQLSQESFDDSDDQGDGDNNPCSAQYDLDRSPIPLRTR